MSTDGQDSRMRHLPIFIDTRGRRIVISGGGDLAVAKLHTLVKTDARLEVFAIDANPALHRWAEDRVIELTERRIRASDLVDALLLYTANGDAAEDAKVRALALDQGVFVNVVDDLESSQFISPALVDRDPVVVAIGTEGTAPVLARLIKSKVEGLLALNLGRVARVAGTVRPAARDLLSSARKRAFWSWFFDRAGQSFLDKLSATESRRSLRQVISRISELPPQSGGVALVGAGPGDPELLTLKARKRVEQADVVLHDRLVDQRVLDLARREALVLEVGKSPGGPAWSQAAINQEMVAHAREGKAVVRLKSGDPMMFGRADEELDALEAAGVEFEVVPGISAANAAASRIGTSLTQRGRNSAITFITGQDTKGYAEQDWRALARRDATFAVYMGVRAARFLQGRVWTPPRLQASRSIAKRYDCQRVSGLLVTPL